jgi:hypothetical protein
MPQNISVIVLISMKEILEKTLNVIEPVKMLSTVNHGPLQIIHGLSITIVMKNVVVKMDILGKVITL